MEVGVWGWGERGGKRGGGYSHLDYSVELRTLVTDRLSRLGELPSAKLPKVLTRLGELRRIQLQLDAPNGRVSDSHVEKDRGVIATEDVRDVRILAHFAE